MCAANKVLALEIRQVLVSQRTQGMPCHAMEAGCPSSNHNTGPNANLLNDSIWIPHLIHI